MTRKEVCEILGLTPGTVQWMLKTGKLQATKTGRILDFDNQSVRLLAIQRQKKLHGQVSRLDAAILTIKRAKTPRAAVTPKTAKPIAPRGRGRPSKQVPAGAIS